MSGYVGLIFIFQRGGNDGVNTMIPRGDPEYSRANRPTLFIDPADALDLRNGFAQLHPALAPMMEIYNRQGLNGAAGPGNLAVLHRIGYRGQSQSHFDSQQYWEDGVPGKASLDEGMIYRQVTGTMDPKTNHLACIRRTGPSTRPEPQDLHGVRLRSIAAPWSFSPNTAR